MTEPLPDTWHSRDLPVLRTIVRLCDEERSSIATGAGVARSLRALTDDEIHRAINALELAGLFEVTRRGDGSASIISCPSAEARRLSGAWPSPDSIADNLLAELKDIAEYGSDEATKSKARKALDGLSGFSRDVLVGVIGSAAGVAMQ